FLRAQHERGSFLDQHERGSFLDQYERGSFLDQYERGFLRIPDPSHRQPTLPFALSVAKRSRRAVSERRYPVAIAPVPTMRMRKQVPPAGTGTWVRLAWLAWHSSRAM